MPMLRLQAGIRLYGTGDIQRRLPKADPAPTPQNAALHFSDVLSVVKMLVIELPIPFRLARIASAMPAMTKPYSTAVAADRSAKKPESKSFKTIPSWPTGRFLRPSAMDPEPKDLKNLRTSTV